MENCGFDFKKIFFAGIGAVAITAEKAHELIHELIEKGEMTVEQGEIITEELKRDIGAKMRCAADAVDPQDAKSVIEMMKDMTGEELAEVKAKLAELEKAE